MVRNRRITCRRRYERAHMAKRQGASTRRNRQRSKGRAIARRDPEGTSNGETSNSADADESKIRPSGRFSSAIMTQAELRRIIAAFAECLDGLVSFPTRCNIVERARAGMYSLHIIIGVRQRKSLRASSLLAAIPGAKPSTLCEFCGSELPHAFGGEDGTCFTEKN